MNRVADIPGEEDNVHGEEKNLVSVFLTCTSCRKVKEIHVFRDRGLPPKIYWDCLDCQQDGNRFASYLKPETQGRSRSCE